MGLSVLFLTSCGVEPGAHIDARSELSKIKGPDTGTIAKALENQASQAIERKDYKRAAQIYKQLMDLYPDKSDYGNQLAENLRKAGDNDNALRVLDVVLKKDPVNVDAKEIKGLCLMNTGEFGEAGKAFGEVMKADPKRWRTLNAVGILFAMKGKYDGSMAYFQEALNHSTDNPSVLNNAALTYAIDRHFDQAYEAFTRARRHVQPDGPEAKHLDMNLALVYAVDGKLDNAEQTAAPHLTKAGLYNNMGFYSYLAKNNELAKNYLSMALTQSPTYYERAWRNINALNGDAASSGTEAAQSMPMDAAAPPAEGKLSVPSSINAASAEQKTKSVGVAELPVSSIPSNINPAAGISLSDIPESKPHIDVPVTETAKNQEPANIKPATKSGKTKAKAKKAADGKEAAQLPERETPAPVQQSSISTEKAELPAAPGGAVMQQEPQAPLPAKPMEDPTAGLPSLPPKN